MAYMHLNDSYVIRWRLCNSYCLGDRYTRDQMRLNGPSKNALLIQFQIGRKEIEFEH